MKGFKQEIAAVNLLPAIPKGINKNFVVFDCNWANSAAKLKCTLRKEKVGVKY